MGLFGWGKKKREKAAELLKAQAEAALAETAKAQVEAAQAEAAQAEAAQADSAQAEAARAEPAEAQPEAAEPKVDASLWDVPPKPRLDPGTRRAATPKPRLDPDQPGWGQTIGQEIAKSRGERDSHQMS